MLRTLQLLSAIRSEGTAAKTNIVELFRSAHINRELSCDMIMIKRYIVTCETTTQ